MIYLKMIIAYTIIQIYYDLQIVISLMLHELRNIRFTPEMRMNRVLIIKITNIKTTKIPIYFDTPYSPML